MLSILKMLCHWDNAADNEIYNDDDDDTNLRYADKNHAKLIKCTASWRSRCVLIYSFLNRQPDWMGVETNKILN